MQQDINNKNHPQSQTRIPDPKRDVIFGGPRGYSHQVYGPIREQRAVRHLLKQNFDLYQWLSDTTTLGFIQKRMLVYLNILAPILHNGGSCFRFLRRRRGGVFVVATEWIDLEDASERKAVMERLCRALNHAWYQTKKATASRNAHCGGLTNPFFRRSADNKHSTTSGSSTPSNTAATSGTLPMKEFLKKMNYNMPEYIFQWMCEDLVTDNKMISLGNDATSSSISDFIIQKLIPVGNTQTGCEDNGKQRTNISYAPTKDTETMIDLITVCSEISLSLVYTFAKEHIDWILYGGSSQISSSWTITTSNNE